MTTKIIRSALSLAVITGAILFVITASRSLPLAQAESKQKSQELPELTSQCYGRGRWGWQREGNYRRLYDINTVETINGKIIRVDRVTRTRGMSSSGVHLLVQTEKDNTISVHLGPSWYVARQDLQLNRNAEIEITGSKIDLDGKSTIIAREVKQGNKTIALRDNNGIPLWSGRMRRSF
ncbi:MAG: hypothetical protein QNJ38_09615 [Prochloraceae cyanobacterium]|nr:hypothetical protein [Prochloraceae cyanobacterium]